MRKKGVYETSAGGYEEFLKDFIYLFLERGEGKERGREKHWFSISYLSYVPWSGTEPETQACALTRNQVATFHFVGWCPTKGATPVRAGVRNFDKLFSE